MAGVREATRCSPDAFLTFFTKGGIKTQSNWCYIQAMKRIIVAALLVMVFASPAFAAKKHHHRHHRATHASHVSHKSA
jgi:predicted S18 family serine protease